MRYKHIYLGQLGQGLNARISELKTRDRMIWVGGIERDYMNMTE